MDIAAEYTISVFTLISVEYIPHAIMRVFQHDM